MSVSGLIFLLIWGLLLAIILVLFWHPKPSWTQTSTSTDRERTNTVFRDDDRYWYAGFFYYNPDDPALFVPKRFGFGWTVNFGHPQGKLVLIAMLLLLLVFGVLLPVLLSGLAPMGCHSFGCSP